MLIEAYTKINNKNHRWHTLDYYIHDDNDDDDDDDDDDGDDGG